MILIKGNSNVEDFYKLPIRENLQLIDGEIIETPTPTRLHHLLVDIIFNKLKEQINHRNIGEIFPAPVDIRLDDKNIFKSDIVFIAKDRIHLVSDHLEGAPDVAIEILSANNSFVNIYKKFHSFEKYGVKEYYLIYPEDLEIIGYKSDNNGRYIEFYREFNVLRSNLMKCEIHIQE